MFINKAIYWVSTGILTVMMLFSSLKYFLHTDQVSNIFNRIGYNDRIVVPLAILKLLGLIAILSRRSERLKELAYFGFLITFILAFEGHWFKNDSGHTTVLLALVSLILSYIFDKRISKDE